MKQRRVLWRLIAGLLIAVILAACQSGETTSQPDASSTTSTSERTTTKATSTKTVTTTNHGISRAVERILHHATEWTSAHTRWVAAYSQREVSYEEFLEVSSETSQRNDLLIGELVYDAKRFPTVMQSFTNGFVENYQGRAAAFDRMIQAEVLADDEAWDAAVEEYSELQDPSGLLQMLEELFKVPEVKATFTEEGTNVDDLLDAMAAMIAQPTTPADASMNRQAFVGALERFSEFTAAWNSAGLDWLAARSDNTVSIGDYLTVSHETELRYRRLIFDLVNDSKRFPTAMQTFTNGMVENYRGRADAFHRVIQAEVAVDNEAWLAAADEYSKYTNPKAVLELAEELFTAPEFEAELADIGLSVDDVLDALAASFGVG